VAIVHRVEYKLFVGFAKEIFARSFTVDIEIKIKKYNIQSIELHTPIVVL
jgi:hypothetical protein